MKKIIFMMAMIPSMIGLCDCTDHLGVSPKQILDNSPLNKSEDVDGSVTAAHARITDIPFWGSSFALWWSGSMCSGDSYKDDGGTWNGGDGRGYMGTFVNLTPDGRPFNYPRYISYRVIQRYNTALQKLEGATTDVSPAVDNRRGEILFLCSPVYFKLKKLFKYVPYIGENVKGAIADFEAVSNRDRTKGND